MKKITNLSGLISLLYLWYNINEWSLSYNANNIVSHIIIKPITYLPGIIVNLLFIVLGLLFLNAIFRNKGEWVFYIISLLLLELLFKISINTLMLEETSSFLFFNVVHPINIELKYFHFSTCIQSLLESNPTDIKDFFALSDVQNIETMQIVKEDIKALNASQIMQYSTEFLNKRIYDSELETTTNIGAMTITSRYFIIGSIFPILYKLYLLKYGQ